MMSNPMSSQDLMFDSQFSINLYGRLMEDFLSVIAPQETSYEVAIPSQQVSLEQVTQLAPQSSFVIAPTSTSQTILAQQFEESDLGKQVQDSWNNFVESGQIWALCVGVIFGYMFRTFTGG